MDQIPVAHGSSRRCIFLFIRAAYISARERRRRVVGSVSTVCKYKTRTRYWRAGESRNTLRRAAAAAALLIQIAADELFSRASAAPSHLNAAP